MIRVTFKPSSVHQGHYVSINGENTGTVINLYAYETISDYREKVNKQIEEIKLVYSK